MPALLYTLHALFDEFRTLVPDQYINSGIAEQNMVGMAAGLARVGYRPFVYGLSAFVPIRVLEQIKIDIAHDNLPVVLLGDGAGFVYSHLGTSHQSTEDIAASIAISGLNILSPCDKYEMTASMHLAYNLKSSVYIRMGKSDRGDIYLNEINDLKLGNLICIKNSQQDNIAIIATGSMVKTATQISDDFNASIWSAPSLKPINESSLIDIAKNYEFIITMEEHSKLGGLGPIVSETISENFPRKILRIGVLDKFSEQCGTYEYLLKEHKLDIENVKIRIKKFLTK